jgi:hypothetical protein
LALQNVDLYGIKKGKEYVVFNFTIFFEVEKWLAKLEVRLLAMTRSDPDIPQQSRTGDIIKVVAQYSQPKKYI